MIDPALLANTTRHALGLVDELENVLRGWSNEQPLRSEIDHVFRALHTIKGGFGFVGLTTITNLVHATEEAVVEIRDHLIPLTPPLLRALLGSVTSLRSLLADPLMTDGVDVSDDINALLTSRGLEPLAEQDDDLPGSAPELPLEPSASQLQQAKRNAQYIYRLTIFSHQDIENQGRSPLDINDLLVLMGDPLVIGIDIDCIGGLDDCLGPDLAYQVLLMTDATLKEIADVVVLPMEQIERLIGRDSISDGTPDLHRLPLELRYLLDAMAAVGGDLAKRLNKRVRFTTKAPSMVLGEHQFQEIQAALAHLLRNALDHGIESLERRREANKAGTAHISIEAVKDSQELRIRLHDDGAGLDHGRILARALTKGLINEKDAREATAATIQDLVFTPGFSSREETSDLSGRGMGMDVVRNAADLCGGTVSISSEQGQGTTAELVLPLAKLTGTLLSPALTARRKRT
ncbi:MAG: ATP-binding protein [Planctomycetota bacterium]|jgi:two-component system chemotaxis sensor kinase CheA|nr:ATP-binding protein [Planctomycetota bacterium]